MPAYGDRASPWRAQGKQQGQAESDHGHEPADQKGGPPTATQGKRGDIHDQRQPRKDQDGHVKAGELM